MLDPIENGDLGMIDESTIIAHPEHHVNILSRMATDKLINNLEAAIHNYDALFMKAGDLTFKFHKDEEICNRAAKVVQSASIGLMQV